MNSRPIGIFDSGIGGLTVLKELLNVLPDEHYLYFGDTARIPYGEKSNEELLSFSREILNWLKSQNVKMVLIACNTSTAATLNIVKNEYDFPIIGLIEPTAEYISQINVNKLGLMATTATVNSKSYSKALKKYNLKVIEIACPELVEIVENDKIKQESSKEKLASYLKPLLTANVEKIILGCTHYPFLIQEMIELGCNKDMFIDPAKCICQAAIEVLEKNNLKNTSAGSVKYFVSAKPESFKKNTQKLFEKSVLVELIKIQNECVE